MENICFCYHFYYLLCIKILKMLMSLTNCQLHLPVSMNLWYYTFMCFHTFICLHSLHWLGSIVYVTNVNYNIYNMLMYYLIYLTLHWPFLINLRLCSLSITSYEYSCHAIWAGLFNALFIWLIYGKVAHWLKFRVLNHGIMGSNPAETVYIFFFVFTYSY